MSIPDNLKKIKGRTGLDSTTIIHLLVIIGVGVSSFGLGRISVDNSPNTASKGMVIEERGLSSGVVANSTQTASVAKSQSQTAGNYVASKNGKLYYTKGCKAANRIKPENEVWFTNSADAEKLGYTRSGSCK